MEVVAACDPRGSGSGGSAATSRRAEVSTSSDRERTPLENRGSQSSDISAGFARLEYKHRRNPNATPPNPIPTSVLVLVVGVVVHLVHLVHSASSVLVLSGPGFLQSNSNAKVVNAVSALHSRLANCCGYPQSK